MSNQNKGEFTSIEEIIANPADVSRNIKDQIKFEMRCAAPAIIKEFDSIKQTVTVQLTTKERIFIRGIYQYIKIPIIADVPIFMPKAGNFVITMPITIGDECLVVFTDTCIDAWFQTGGEENEQMFQRRHDLSDCFALCGIWNQKQVITDYSTDTMQIRSLDNVTNIDITDSEINIKSTTVNVEATTVNLGDSSGTRKLIDERLVSLFNNHTHLYNPGPGAATYSGTPLPVLTTALCSTTKTGAL